MHAKATKADIVRCCFEAYKRNDRSMIEDALSDDFRFTSPYDDAIGKAEYFRRCWPAHRWIEEHLIERIVEGDDGIFVTYKVVGTNGKSFRNTEFFTFDGDRVASVHVYFGESYENGRFVPQKLPGEQ